MTAPDDSQRARLSAEFVFEAQAALGERTKIGPSKHGERWFVPITGGHFAGPELSGEVLPGVDWQLARSDGVLELDAHYSLRVSDGTLIEVRNRGIVVTSATAGDEPRVYSRTVPSFSAPHGSPHAWLNQTLFLGTVARSGRRQVSVRVYKVL